MIRALALALAGCLPGPTFHGGPVHSGPYYRGGAPLAEAAIAERRARIERRELMQELRRIRTAIEDDR